MTDPLCNKCMACVEACPGNAISRTKTVKVELAGRTVEWESLIQRMRHSVSRAEKVKEGERGTYMEGRDDLKPNFISPFYHKPKPL